MKVSFTTLGCKVNQFDTALMQEAVQKADHQLASGNEPADVYVINSCSVTDHADQEARDIVRKALRGNPNAKIVVTGCYAQTNPLEVGRIPGIHLVIGNSEKLSIARHLDRLAEEGMPASCVGEIMRERTLDQPLLNRFMDKTRAFLKIQDGCNSRCTFCLIPRARGNSRSLAPDSIARQVRHFENAGYREVVLSGINLGSYGADLRPKWSLGRLLEFLIRKTEALRFRLSSIEPELITEDLVDQISRSSRICRHFHIPLQSGDPDILRKMNRRYGPEKYRIKIEQIHFKIPDAAIGADVMTGFPGESERAFQHTADLVQDLPISYLHVFPYSPREKTAAWNYPDPVPVPLARERGARLRSLGRLKKENFYSRFIGRRMTALIEREEAAEEPGRVRGMTDNYLRVHLDRAIPCEPNSLVEIIPQSLDSLGLFSIPA